MTWLELKKKRKFTISKGFTDDLFIQFESSSKKLAREAYSLMKDNGVTMSFEDIEGEKEELRRGFSVGHDKGYAASGFVYLDLMLQYQEENKK